MRIDVVDGFHAEARMPECRGHCPIGSIACVKGACEKVSPANAEASTPGRTDWRWRSDVVGIRR